MAEDIDLDDILRPPEHYQQAEAFRSTVEDWVAKNYPRRNDLSVNTYNSSNVDPEFDKFQRGAIEHARKKGRHWLADIFEESTHWAEVQSVTSTQIGINVHADTSSLVSQIKAEIRDLASKFNTVENHGNYKVPFDNWVNPPGMEPLSDEDLKDTFPHQFSWSGLFTFR